MPEALGALVASGRYTVPGHTEAQTMAALLASWGKNAPGASIADALCALSGASVAVGTAAHTENTEDVLSALMGDAWSQIEKQKASK